MTINNRMKISVFTKRSLLILTGALVICSSCKEAGQEKRAGDVSENRLSQQAQATALQGIWQTEAVAMPEKQAAQNTDTDKRKMIWINDLDEGLLQVPYQPKLPHHDYDWDSLSLPEEDGFRKYEDERYETQLGIDVSKFQGGIDWQKVAEQKEIDFAIIRLGYRGYGSGKLKLDSRFTENMNGAQTAGLSTGVYFFSQAVNPEEAEEEAEFIALNIRSYEVDGPVVFDTEKIKDASCRTENLTVEELTDITAAFCERIKKLGYHPMIYANAKWLTTRLDLSRLKQYEIWYADYTNRPLYPYWFQMWQYSNEGKVSGINTNVDLNLYFVEKKQ